MKGLLGVSTSEQLSMLPHDETVLAHMVRFHLKNGSKDMFQHIRQARLRPHVVLKLLHVLIERNHGAFRGKGSAELLKLRIRTAVEARYPDQETHLPEHSREGHIPVKVLEVLESSLRERGARSVVVDKNATPADGAQSFDAMFDSLRPHAIVEERSSRNTAEINARQSVVLSKYSDLKVQTGSSFEKQWRPQYVTQVLPFTFPRMVGGPEFDAQDRWRRTEHDAPVVTPFAFTRSMARRVEAQIRCDWVFTSLNRKVWFRH